MTKPQKAMKASPKRHGYRDIVTVAWRGYLGGCAFIAFIWAGGYVGIELGLIKGPVNFSLVEYIVGGLCLMVILGIFLVFITLVRVLFRMASNRQAKDGPLSPEKEVREAEGGRKTRGHSLAGVPWLVFLLDKLGAFMKTERAWVIVPLLCLVGIVIRLSGSYVAFMIFLYVGCALMFLCLVAFGLHEHRRRREEEDNA